MTRRPAADSPQRWRSSSDLRWVRYDDGDEWIVYNAKSADIHLLTHAARELWRLVDVEPGLSTPDLVARLSEAVSMPIDDELGRVTAETLAFMDRAGLIAPVAA